MSYTITSGKRAGVFFMPNGQPIYALFEKTCESNVYPRVPRWSCIGIGSYDLVVERIFSCAAACSSGCLKSGPSRDIKPENYIAAWMRLLEDPSIINLEHRVHYMDWKRQRHWMMDEDKAAEKAKQIFAKHNRLDLFEQIVTNNTYMPLSYEEYGPLLIDLFTMKTGICSAYHFLSESECLDSSCEIPLPQIKDGYTLPKIVAYKHHGGGVMVKFGDGEWMTQREFGVYCFEQDYLTDVAYQAELRNPGSTKRLLQELRFTLENAPLVNPNTTVTITLPVTEERAWFTGYFEEVSNALPSVVQNERTLKLSQADFEAINGNAHYHLYTLLGAKDVHKKWQFDESAAITAPKGVYMQQESLFAA